MVVDVHTHFTIETTAVSEDSEKVGYTVENKSIEEHLAAMDRLKIDVSVLTCPTQKFLDDKEKCIEYCKAVNNHGAKIVKKYPDRFRFAAILPLPYAEAAVEELERAVKELKAVAVGLCSNYDGRYLADEEFDKVFAKMNELNIPGILHPAPPLDYPKGPVTGKILPMYEFITDSTRTMLDLFAAETLNRYPNVKLVVPHTGSCLPVAIDRFHGIMRSLGKDVEIPFDQLYFDLACDAYPHAVRFISEFTEKSHILYGTDYPAIPEFVLNIHRKNTEECEVFSGHLEDVLGGNASRLFNI